MALRLEKKIAEKAKRNQQKAGEEFGKKAKEVEDAERIIEEREIRKHMLIKADVLDELGEWEHASYLREITPDPDGEDYDQDDEDKEEPEQQEQLLTNLSNPIEPAHTRRDVAAFAGISEGTIAKIKGIESTGTPELKQAIQDEKVSIHTASNLDTSQRAMPAVDDEADYAVLAKERQATSTGGNEPQLVANLPEADKGRAREHAARDWNVSARSVQDAKAVISKGANQKRTL
ncbi:MAG: hypothetical protein HQK59_14295 [Deltaproteobacteria bacterium]|nr:hypothetical protein [Deltaproteobacteria bacterium]